MEDLQDLECGDLPVKGDAQPRKLSRLRTLREISPVADPDAITHVSDLNLDLNSAISDPSQCHEQGSGDVSSGRGGEPGSPAALSEPEAGSAEDGHSQVLAPPTLELGPTHVTLPVAMHGISSVA